MKKNKINLSNILFLLFLVLMLIPQTRKPIQVAINKVRILVLSPSLASSEEQTSLKPFEYSVNALNGSATFLSVGKGGVTFISYWATWCPPCIAELPSIQKLYADYGDKMDFLLLTNEKPTTVHEFLKKRNYDLPIYFPQMKAPDALYSKSIPTSYIIDPRGKIMVKETGAVDWNSAKTRQLLDKLIIK